MRRLCLLMVLICFVAVTGCGKVKIKPELNNSLGYSAFQKMHSFKEKNVAIAVYFDPELLNANVTESVQLGEYQFSVGKSLAVKLIKGLSYQFEEVYLVDYPQVPAGIEVQALVSFGVQEADTDVNVKVGWNTVEAQSSTRISIHSTVKEISTNTIIWDAAALVTQDGGIEEKMLTYQEAGRGFATGIDSATDKIVGDLLHQLSGSAIMKPYYIKWEQEREL